MDGFPTVLSDGETMAVCYGDSVYLLKQPYMKSFSASYCGCSRMELDLTFAMNNFELIPKEDLKIGKDLFNNLTVNELLSLIKTKLKQRK